MRPGPNLATPDDLENAYLRPGAGLQARELEARVRVAENAAEVLGGALLAVEQGHHAQVGGGGEALEGTGDQRRLLCFGVGASVGAGRVVIGGGGGSRDVATVDEEVDDEDPRTRPQRRDLCLQDPRHVRVRPVMEHLLEYIDVGAVHRLGVEEVVPAERDAA